MKLRPALPRMNTAAIERGVGMANVGSTRARDDFMGREAQHGSTEQEAKDRFDSEIDGLVQNGQMSFRRAQAVRFSQEGVGRTAPATGEQWELRERGTQFIDGSRVR